MRLGFDDQRSRPCGDAAFRHGGFELEELERPADAAEPPACAPKERRVRPPRELAQPQVQHLRRELLR